MDPQNTNKEEKKNEASSMPDLSSLLTPVGSTPTPPSPPASGSSPQPVASLQPDTPITDSTPPLADISELLKPVSPVTEVKESTPVVDPPKAPEVSLPPLTPPVSSFSTPPAIPPTTEFKTPPATTTPPVSDIMPPAAPPLTENQDFASLMNVGGQAPQEPTPSSYQAANGQPDFSSIMGSGPTSAQPSAQAAPPPMPVTPAPPAKKKGRSPLTKVLFLVIGLLFMGSAAVGFYFISNANQQVADNRNHAACLNCPGGPCPDGTSYQGDTCAPQASCALRAQEACRDHQGGGGGGGGTTSGGGTGTRTTCDNGVAVGGTACNHAGDTQMYKCVSPQFTDSRQWQTVACGSGQTCQGNACTTSSGGGTSTGGGTSGGGAGCSTTCANGRTFSDPNPFTFASCQAWANEACGTVSSTAQTVSGTIGGSGSSGTGGGGTASAGGVGCAATCANGKTFADPNPYTFASCQAWATQACGTVSSTATTVTGSLGGSSTPTLPSTYTTSPGSCSSGGSFCNCGYGYTCSGLSGAMHTQLINNISTNCYAAATATITCVKIAGTPTTLNGGQGTACDNPLSRSACGTNGCAAGQQRLCTNIGGSLVLGACDVTDACAAQQQTVSGGGSCAGLKRLSVGEPSRGAFVGCSGSQNCFCPDASVNVGSAVKAGNVQCYSDVGNDSCGAPGLAAATAAPTQPPQQPTSVPPTATPIVGQCTSIKVYKDTAVVSPSTLKPGDNVTLAVIGTNASKARFRINGGSFTETTTQNSASEYTLPFTIPNDGTTQFSIEAEVNVLGVWK